MVLNNTTIPTKVAFAFDKFYVELQKHFLLHYTAFYLKQIGIT